VKTLEEKVKDVHEINELHEMLTFKNVCMTKSTVMASVAQDPAFKNLLQQDISITMKHCQELKNLLLLKRTRTTLFVNHNIFFCFIC